MTIGRPDAKGLVDLFASTPTKALIANLSTRVELFDLAGHPVPLTVNDGNEPANCYICDPVTGYVDYAREETRHFMRQPALQKTLVVLVGAVAPIVRATGLDRSVQVNNWLFSTNPVIQMTRPDIAEMRDRIIARFPDHVVLMRSLNTIADARTLAAFTAEGFDLIPSRQVYLFDGRAQRPASRDMKADFLLMQRTPYQVVAGDTFDRDDFVRCADLYRQLYLEKYTPLNPQYTARFIAQMSHIGLLDLQGLRDEAGRLAAFGGRFQMGGTLTQPLLGYDTGLPQDHGLYRLITALAQQDATKRGLVFNMSAGAAGFKRLRNAVPAIEYSAVFSRHLPRRQRLALLAVRAILTGLGVPVMKRFGL